MPEQPPSAISTTSARALIGSVLCGGGVHADLTSGLFATNLPSPRSTLGRAVQPCASASPTVAVGAALAIGTAYSSPPVRLKRFPALATASISLVRAAVVNVGVYLHFASTLGGRPGLSELPGPIVALTLFVLPFSFAIAVLKDIPDAEGDRRYRIATFTVRLGARAAFLRE